MVQKKFELKYMIKNKEYSMQTCYVKRARDYGFIGAYHTDKDS
ncbi:hypothetical protein LPICM02_330044 [Pseudolactococcus piscium]|nr:hypothetical protein LPICM02_330044 [Lactococcus piscium]